MLPQSRTGVGVSSGKVQSRLARSQESVADDRPDAIAFGPVNAYRGVRSIRARTWRRGANELPDGAVGRRGTACDRDCMAGPTWAGSGAHRAASLSSGGPGGFGAPQAPRSRRPGDADLARRIAAGDRVGPTDSRCGQCGVDDAVAVGVLAARDWPSHGHRDGADASASTRLRLQTPDVVVEAQIDRTGRVGKKRL